MPRIATLSSLWRCSPSWRAAACRSRANRPRSGCRGSSPCASTCASATATGRPTRTATRDATPPRATTASTATTSRARTIARRLPRAGRHRCAGSFVSSDGGATITRNAGYTALLGRRTSRAPAGFRWEGYISTERPFDPALPEPTAPPASSPSSCCRPGADGAPFAGPFRWRAVVGFRATGAGAASPGDPIVCDLFAGTVCFDSPAAGIDERAVERTSATSACSPGAGPRSARARPRTSSFGVVNRDGGGLGARTVALSAASDLPGATAVAGRARRSRCRPNGTATGDGARHGPGGHAARHLHA